MFREQGIARAQEAAKDLQPRDQLGVRDVCARASRRDFRWPRSLFVGRRVQLATLATRYAVPTSFSVRDNAEAGGLMSYGRIRPQAANPPTERRAAKLV